MLHAKGWCKILSYITVRTQGASPRANVVRVSVVSRDPGNDDVMMRAAALQSPEIRCKL